MLLRDRAASQTVGVIRRFSIAALALLAASGPLPAQQLGPAGTGGIGALDRALARLAGNKRVLVIAAHPDDEDSELLTYLSRGVGADAAYLSLSRGEGGQNLIGPELGEALGILRSGELLAARGLDGARQFFTRAFDFGFSKTLSETQRWWIPDSLLADAILVARRVRPQIIVSVWSGTPRDGHGQHQMSGVIARRLFDVLADSAWGPVKLYQTTRFDTSGTTLTIPLETIDPIEGRSYFQIAMAARSKHRSQNMGQVQRLGPSVARLRLVASRLPGGTNGALAAAGLFEGVDTALAPGLERYAALVDSARSVLAPGRMGGVLPLLASALNELRQRGPEGFRAAKEPLLEEAIATAASVVVDATADDAAIAPGQTLRVTVTAWDAGTAHARVRRVLLRKPAGWSVVPQPMQLAADGGTGPFLRTEPIPTYRFNVTLPASADLSEPYYLRRPLRGGLYDWSGVPDSLRGDPFDSPPLVAEVLLDIAGATVHVLREVTYRYGDQASGEIRRPLAVVPRVGVAVSPDVIVWPVDARTPRTVTVELVNGARDTTAGEVRLELPAGWPPVPPQQFVLVGQEARRSFTFEVRSPAGLRPGTFQARAVAAAGGATYDRASIPVDYPHIRPARYVVPATVRLEAAALALPRVRRVGYVRGASDMVPEELLAVGVPLTLLSELDLERGDLSAYDVIVIGSRAYETAPALVANNGRLLDWVRAGGRMIVQYQQYQLVQGNFAPFRLTMARPHDRVTDEASPVAILEPASPLFTTPNAIGPADWNGWVQERGLYFAHEWDPAYRPMLEMGDAGERLRGGLLVAKLDRGLYVYTGLSFFRQLPAGVPGAYRLFMNLLALTPSSVR